MGSTSFVFRRLGALSNQLMQTHISPVFVVLGCSSTRWEAWVHRAQSRRSIKSSLLRSQPVSDGPVLQAAPNATVLHCAHFEVPLVRLTSRHQAHALTHTHTPHHHRGWHLRYRNSQHPSLLCCAIDASLYKYVCAPSLYSAHRPGYWGRKTGPIAVRSPSSSACHVASVDHSSLLVMTPTPGPLTTILPTRTNGSETEAASPLFISGDIVKSRNGLRRGTPFLPPDVGEADTPHK